MQPDWIIQDAVRPHVFHIDADKAYPAVLAVLKVEAVDQYWLEVVHDFIKLDAQIATAGVDLHRPREFRIRGGDGFKQRWGQAHHKPGRHDALRKKDENAYRRTVASEARALYKRIRGVLPA